MSTTPKDQRRRAPRRNTSKPSVIRIELRDGMGNPRTITADLADWSETGLSLNLVAPIKPGAMIQVRGKLGDERVEISRRATITWCNEDSQGGYRIGVEFLDGKSDRSGGNSDQHSNGRSEYKSHTVASDFQDQDYYEIMQLSPNADTETIHRVYRLLAQRYHPDNADTGDSELFVELTTAFQVLSDPERRAAYDARHTSKRQLRWKIFDQAVVATGPEVEKRKRQGILALLYASTVKDPERASMTVHAFEDLLGCPREHLEAALWYLRGKGHVQRTDGGRYTLTVHGFEEAEQHVVTPPKNAGELPEPARKA
ncbi:MAG: DnaJ domain-containing protein [Acidobacteriia bacterium]|nr:DnaJ domain-containing protein [Terriglobia bacterium]